MAAKAKIKPVRLVWSAPYRMYLGSDGLMYTDREARTLDEYGTAIVRGGPLAEKAAS